MKQILIFLFFSLGLSAQVINKTDSNRIRTQDSIVIDNGHRDSLKIFKPTISDYKYRTQFGAEKVFDTTFTIRRSYEYTQYNNRDNFGKIQFANIGAGFQDLVFKINPEQNLTLLPTNKSHFILGIDDIKYYDVKTPTTTFIYHSAMRQGAALQSTYTQNFGKNFNIAAEYMGLRSKGFYDNSLTANNRTLFSAHYKMPNNKYEAFAHFIHQNVNAEEYGGIADLSLFTGGDSRFKNRENLQVNLNSSNSRYGYRRYYFSHSFRPFATEKFPFSVRHTIFYQTNKYIFNLGSGDLGAFEATQSGLDLSSKKFSKNLSNTLSVIFDNERFKLDAGVRYQNLKLGYKDVFITNSPERSYTENRIGAVGNLQIDLWDRFALKTFLEYSNGSRYGSYLRSANNLRFEPWKDYFADVNVDFQSVAPSFNALVNSSSVLNANYDTSAFKNENVMHIGGKVGLKWFDAQLFADYYRVANYAYFDNSMQPQQSSEGLNVTQIGGEATFGYRKFHLNTRLLFQSHLNGKDLYPVPAFVGRANVYWQSWAFKNAAEIMAGIKVYYFSKFDSREYAPLLNEFVLAGAKAYPIGGQPIVDPYINLRVKTMQFYIEGQNVTATFMQNRSYTAPYYPLYDFRLNIGILWQLFH